MTPMSSHENEIPAEVKDFVFQYIDSVEQLEILFLLSADPERYWTANEIHRSLRSNLNSIEKRLAILVWYHFIDKKDGKFSFKPADPKIVNVIQDLTKSYKVHRHKIYELVYSPMKKCRDFAEAFVFKPDKDPKGESNG